MISQTQKQAVVLLHGLAANRLVMFRLSKILTDTGFHTVNWGYRSTRGSIESHARAFHNHLNDLASEGRHDLVHIVGHSMGSIVARRAISLSQPANLGRLVMLGPPNRGSHVARKLSWPLGRVCPALRELSDAPHSYVNQLDEPGNLEHGIIAAAEDRVVKLPSTYLASQKDHIVLPGHHGVLPWRRETAKQVIHFLKHGKFSHAE
jgi:pimeloyl-ACP methyl ester carboxylesterase